MNGKSIEPNMVNYEETRRSFRLEVPDYFNFGSDVVDKWAEARTKVALIAVDPSGENPRTFTFWDIKNLSNRFANVLKKHGAEKGDLAFIMLPRIPEWHICMVGMFKLGVIPIPSTILLTPRDIEYRINRAEAKIVITDVENASKIEEIRKKCPSLKTLIVLGGERNGWISYEEEMKEASRRLDCVEKMRMEDTLLIYFTSGTEAYPKMVRHTQEYALAHIVTARFWQDLKPTDLHWTLSDTGWAKAAWGYLFGQWIIGTAVFQWNMKGKFNPEMVLELLEKYGITVFCAPPTVYRMLVRENLEKYDFSELRHCVSAGEPLNPEVIRIWREKTGIAIHDGYGQTETVNVIANYRCMRLKPGSMGKPAPGWDVAIVDDDGNPLPPNTEGHIAIRVKPKRPIGLFAEYWKDPKGTSSRFRGEWYFTGDKAYVDEEGYFWFIGRADDVIKSSGYRISPFEVESALIEHPAVLEAAVIGVPDDIRGQIVKAFIVLSKDYQPSEELIEELQNHVKRVTAPYKYPRKIEFVKALPKTISGKIRRKALRMREMKK